MGLGIIALDHSSQESELSFTKLESYTHLQDALDISASASFNWGYSKGSAEAKYSKSLKMSEYSSFMLVQVRAQNTIEILKKFKITPESKQLLKADHATELSIALNSLSANINTYKVDISHTLIFGIIYRI